MPNNIQINRHINNWFVRALQQITDTPLFNLHITFQTSLDEHHHTWELKGIVGRKKKKLKKYYFKPLKTQEKPWNFISATYGWYSCSAKSSQNKSSSWKFITTKWSLKAWAYYVKRQKRWRLNEASGLLGLWSRGEMPSSHQQLPAKYTHTEKRGFLFLR